MPSIYGSTINDSPRDGAQAGMTPMRRQANPSGSGGWSGGMSNGGGYNTRGSQPSRAPQSAYGQSAQSYGGASYGGPSYSRGSDGPTPNESQSQAQSRQQAMAAPQTNGYAPRAQDPAPTGYPGLSPIPTPAPLPSTTASPDQLMAARFNIPGLTPGLGLPQPAPIPVQSPHILLPPQPPQPSPDDLRAAATSAYGTPGGWGSSTYGGMFAR